MMNPAPSLHVVSSADASRRREVASLAARQRPTPVVLLALFEHGRPTTSLYRAVALARVLRADLHVMRVLPDLTAANGLFPASHEVKAVLALERGLDASRATRSWLRGSLGEAGANATRFTVEEGDFVDVVAARAADLDASLIVVPPGDGWFGNTVASLAHLSGVSVLVAREATRDDTIVAATDLQSEGFPVLKRAARLGQQLDVPVVALHNVNPMPDFRARDMPFMMWPWTTVRDGPVQELRSDALVRATDTLAVDALAVVRSEASAVDAILAEAREHDADIVVVGTRKRGWFDRITGWSVAAQVVDRARRSVLVTPLDDVDLAARR